MSLSAQPPARDPDPAPAPPAALHTQVTDASTAPGADVSAHSAPRNSEIPVGRASATSAPPARAASATLNPAEVVTAVFPQKDGNTRLHLLKNLVARFGAQAITDARLTYTILNGSSVAATALFAAAHTDCTETARYLIDECDADINVGAPYKSLYVGHVHYVTPLAIAAVSGHVSAVRLLVERGASLGPGLSQEAADAARGRAQDSSSAMDTPSPSSDPPQVPGSHLAPRSRSRSAQSSGRFLRRSPGAIEHLLCHDTSRRSEVDYLGYVNPLWAKDGPRVMGPVTEILLNVPSLRVDWSSVSDPDLLSECPLLLAARNPLLIGVLEHCLALGFTLGPDTSSIILTEASAWGNVKAARAMLTRGANVRYRSHGSSGHGDFPHVNDDAASSSGSVSGGPEGTVEHSADDSFSDGAAAAGASSSKKKKTNNGLQQQQPSVLSETAAGPSTRNNYTPLLAACAHLKVMDELHSRYCNVIPQSGYDPLETVLLLIRHGASVTARDGRGRTSLWHVASSVDGESVDHPPEWDPTGQMASPTLRETCIRLYRILQRFGAVGYMGPGAPSSMLLNSSSIDTDDDEGISGSWNDSVAAVDTCAICLEPLSNLPVVRMDDCNHVHHVMCIEQWREKKDVCPQCSASDSAQQQHMMISPF
jgi:Ring finger domain/Ankyrin repeats (3 copies)